VGKNPGRLLRQPRPLPPRRAEKEARLVFADTLHWGAILHPLDQYRAQVIRVRQALGEIRLVTTDEVLTELLDGLAERGPHLRRAAARAIRTILSDRRVTVHPQSRPSFLAGLRLYEQRNDKGYSLVDCIFMTTMRRHRISEVLTNVHHFTQEGFEILLR
jgi:predicted nucleic acid-binding protein